jgi:hypothetical protein
VIQSYVVTLPTSPKAFRVLTVAGQIHLIRNDATETVYWRIGNDPKDSLYKGCRSALKKVGAN